MAILLPVAAIAQSPPKVNLQTAGNFAVLAGSTITSTGLTIITGDIGVAPGSAITGFPPGVVIGTIHIDVIASQAKGDLSTAYGDAAGRTLAPITVAGNIGGQTLAPGLYKSTSSLAISSGDLYLDAGNDANAVWIFQVASTLTTTSGRQIVLANGAQSKNIFWQVGSSATLGTNSVFYGNILASQSITIATGATLIGRALAQTGAVSCGSNTITKPDSLAAKAPVFTTASRSVDVGGRHIDSTSWTLISIANTGNDTLRIATATSSKAVFSSHLGAFTVAPGSSTIDSVKFLPLTLGADSAVLRFTSNAASSPDTIIVRGLGTAAILSMTSRNVNVGTAFFGTPTWTLVTLSNTGNDTLRFVAATGSNPVFVSHLSALKIAPGASITDSIRFLPTRVGADTGKLFFTSNALVSPDSMVVYGFGRGAILTVTSRSVDLGVTPVGTPAWSVLTIFNSGNDSLHITLATSTNAVFSSHLSSAWIAPGSSIIDVVKFLPTAMGPVFGKLIFAGNAATSPDTIVVSGVGTTAILQLSTRNVDFGAVPVGASSWRLVTISNAGNDTLRMSTATSSSYSFSSHLSASSIAPGASMTDSIMYHPTTVGPEAATILLTSNALSMSDTIAVRGLGKGAILTTESRTVNCGMTPVGTPAWTVVALYNDGNIPLNITAATSTNAAFSSHLTGTTIQPGSSISDTVLFLPTVQGAIAGHLVFASNAITAPDTIAVNGTGTSATHTRTAVLSTASRNVNCGIIPIGKSTWTLITLANTGDDTLRISSAVSTNPVFASQLSALEIAPAGSAIDLVVFSPETIEGHAGQLIVTSNAVSSPDTITLRGIGTSVVAVNEGTILGPPALGTLYPNPLTDATQLQMQLQDGEQILHAGLYDMMGREVQDWTARLSTNTSLPLHLGQFPNGVYVARFQTTLRTQASTVSVVK